MTKKIINKMKKIFKRKKNPNIFPDNRNDISENHTNDEMMQYLELALKDNIKNIRRRTIQNELKKKRREIYND